MTCSIDCGGRAESVPAGAATGAAVVGGEVRGRTTLERSNRSAPLRRLMSATAIPSRLPPAPTICTATIVTTAVMVIADHLVNVRFNPYLLGNIGLPYPSPMRGCVSCVTLAETR